VPETKPTKYAYAAYVVRVIDGDTLEVDVDLGLWTWCKGIKLRMARINMPEIDTDAGFYAKSKLEMHVLGRGRVLLHTIKNRHGKDREDKYGRLLAEVWVGDTNVNDAMIEWWEARRGKTAM
jgi:micrococcal nuclease